MKPTGRFLNVDLDVTANRPLTRLGKAFEALGASVLHCGRIEDRFVLTVESGSLQRRRPGPVILELCRLVEALPPAARLMWEQATTRSFDIGLEAAESRRFTWVAIQPGLLERVVRLRGSVAVSVYPRTAFSSAKTGKTAQDSNGACRPARVALTDGGLHEEERRKLLAGPLRQTVINPR